jgi:hypothetical protein
MAGIITANVISLESHHSYVRMNSTKDDNTLLCSKEKGEVVMADTERRLSSETSHGQFISKRAVPALVVTLIESSEIDDSSLNEPHMLSLCDSCGDGTGQNASSSPVNNDTDDAFIDMETGMVEEGMEPEARLTSYSHDCHGQYRSGAFVVTDLDGGGSNHDGCDNQTANTSSLNHTRVVNTRDLDRIVNKRIQQALEEERKRASLAQIASENAEFSSSPQEAANDSAEKRSLCDPKNCLLPFCVPICSPRGRLLSIAIISAIFGTASIVVAIIYVATKED